MTHGCACIGLTLPAGINGFPPSVHVKACFIWCVMLERRITIRLSVPVMRSCCRKVRAICNMSPNESRVHDPEIHEPEKQPDIGLCGFNPASSAAVKRNGACA